MSKPTSKNPRGNPNLANVRQNGKGSVKGRTRSGKFPKYLEDFCHHIHAGLSTREAAALVGRSPTSGPYLRHREDVRRRLDEIEHVYKDGMVEGRVESSLVSEQYFDLHLMQMAAHGEGKGKRGRLKACEIGYRKLHKIDPPSANTLIALMASQKSAGGAGPGQSGLPRLYTPKRFLQAQMVDAEKPKSNE